MRAYSARSVDGLTFARAFFTTSRLTENYASCRPADPYRLLVFLMVLEIDGV